MATGASTQTAQGTAPRPAGEALIELAGVGRFFQAAGGVQALADVTLTIGRGEFVCVMGPSGSGKSTLMNILGCLDRPTSGRYRLRGQAVDALMPDALAALRRDVFGFVFQSYNLIGSASAEENVELPATYAGLRRADRLERAQRLLRSLGLGHRLRHRPGALSGGEQQRVAIARALMNGGEVLLADEPTGALDAASGTEVMSTLRGLAERGHTVVVITHDPDVAAWAWRRIDLRDGRVVADTGPAFAPVTDGRAAGDSPTAGDGVRAGAPAGASWHPAANPVPPSTRPVTPSSAQWRARLATLGEEVGTSVRALRANLLRGSRLRTVLTMLSVTVGVWAVVALLSVVQGAYHQGVLAAARTGAGTVFVGATARIANRPVTPARLTLADVDAIEGLANVRAAVPSIYRRMTIQRADRDLEVFLKATTADGLRAGAWPLAHGTIWTEAEADGLAAVAVIGAYASDQLLPAPLPAVGEYILVADVPFLVKGVLARQSPPGRMVYENDKDVFVPLKTALALWFQEGGLDIQVASADPLRVEETARAVLDALVRRHGDAGIQLTLAGSREGLSTIEKLLSTLIGTVGAVSLVVGGLGVMSVMLIAVTERRREIGIRMATGARRRDIARQFLLEAAVVTCAGGLLGTALGTVTGPALEAAGLTAAFSPWFVAAALASAIGTGVAAGFAPARRAAMLDPVRALAR